MQKVGRGNRYVIASVTLCINDENPRSNPARVCNGHRVWHWDKMEGEEQDMATFINVKIKSLYW